MIVADFPDLCLVTYLLVDDLWKELPADLKPRGEQSDCSNSELLTMVLVEECMGWDEWDRPREGEGTVRRKTGR